MSTLFMWVPQVHLKSPEKVKFGRYFLFLDRLFLKKTLRYCHRPGVIGGGGVRKLWHFSNISVITEDIYLKLRIIVHYQKGNTYQ